ncbi:hypothetical protein NQZ79_g1314 [Umbelopsis isabellina]|nr:hypothetical protein NQZ79_g1314 [Umbelopsis isabellina]
MAQQSLPFNQQLGLPNTNVPWRAGHASVYVPPYVVVYGGVKDASANYSGSLTGSDDIWVWNVNGSWYNPQPIMQNSSGTLLPQVLFPAVSLPSQGQLLALVSNTTGGGYPGTLQVLDTTAWSWSFPTPQVQPPTRTQASTAVIVNNTIYSYGGSSVDVNGMIQSNSVQNTLSSLDANSFTWSQQPNGPALTDHASCYLPKCDCIVTFGGSSTGNANEVLSDVNIYNLGSSTWNLKYSVNSVAGASPGPRRLHTATCLNDKAIIYGGGTTQPLDNDVWILDASAWPALNWSRQDTNKANGPSNRMGHSAVLDSSTQNIYFFGGWGASATNDKNMYVLSTSNWTWSSVPVTGYAAATSSSAAVGPSATAAPPPDTSTTNTTPIIAGSVVGGVVLIAALIAAIFFYRRRKNSKYIVTDKEVFVREGMPPDSYNNSSKNLTETGNGSYGMTENTTSNHLMNGSNRHSTAWTLSSYNDSLGRMGTVSELGDRNSRMLTGVLEMIPPVMNSDSEAMSRGSQESGRKILLEGGPNAASRQMSLQGPGQTPNEFDSYERQKPNEYSTIVKSPHQDHSVMIDKRHSQAPSTHEGAPLSSSMEVFRSSMNTMSDMAAPVMITHAMAKHSDHDNATSSPQHNGPVDDDEAWTFADSLSFNGDGPPPIRYIPPSGSSRHFSVATTSSSPSTALYASKHLSRSSVPLTHHQHSSVPVARPATPPNVSLPSLSGTSPAGAGSSDIYRAVSPLDMLATLGSVHDNNEVIVESPRDSLVADSGNQSSSEFLSTPENEPNTPSEATVHFISSLPERYSGDPQRPTIDGPLNSVIFVQTSDTHIPRSIKWFGRREAWERECRTLMKLRSPYVVELVEVLTIQDSKNMTIKNQEEESVQYATVMECLDETLGSVIRHARRNKRKVPNAHAIIKEIAECLGWCHSRGIAFCDLKPSNIMHNRRNGHWKLIDFEASRTIGEELVGVITPRYCPPEVARATTYGLEGANGVVATASVDMWALGCVLYELETSSPLFPNNITDSTILHFISHPSSSTPALNNGLRWNDETELVIPDLDSLVQDTQSRSLIRNLLSRDPAKRNDVASVLRSTYLRQAQQLPHRTPSQRGLRHTVDVVNSVLPQTAHVVTNDTLPNDD